MHKQSLIGSLLVSLLLVVSARQGFALNWNAENTPTTNTLLLYHLNEGSGTNVTDAGAYSFHSSLIRDCFASEGTGSWSGSGAGTYLKGYTETNQSGDYIRTRAVTNVNWSRGLTISFWYRVRDETGSPNANSLFYLNGPGVVPRVFFNTDVFGTASNGRLNFTDTQGPGADLNTGNVNYGSNHVWRHIAMVYDAGGNAADGGTWSFYLDNVQTGTVIAVTQDLSTVSTFDIRFMSGIFSTNGMSADFDEILVENSVLTDFSAPNGPPGDGDADDDGIADAWEEIWCDNGDCDPAGDTGDGDPYPYLDEYVLDSNPTVSNEFAVDGLAATSPATVQFLSTNSRNYTVEYSADLAIATNWTALGAAQPGSNGVHTVADPATDVHRCYRVRVVVP